MEGDFRGDEMTISEISPKGTHALIVGIETYDVELEHLNGAANDAIKFANWLLGRGVERKNIHLFVSPLRDNKHLLNNTNLAPQPATEELISNIINQLIHDDNVIGELLYVFWSGHGILTPPPNATRRVYFSNVNNYNYKNLNLNSLQEALQTSFINKGFNRQVFLIDACATVFFKEHIDIEKIKADEKSFSPKSLDEKKDQFVLFAVDKYQDAQNQKESGGVFSQAVMEELRKLPQDCLLADMEQLTQRVEEKLTKEGKPKPVYKRYWDGSEEYFPMPLQRIDWHKVCQEMLAERQQLSTNLLTVVEGVDFQVKDVYVPLGLVERKKPSQVQDDASPEKGSELYKETEITKTFQHHEFLEEVLKQNNTPKSQGKRIAIIGEPGSGKTTLLQQIADWISKEIEQSIVIWVSLADLQGRELEEEYIFKTWLTAAVRSQGRAEAKDKLRDNFASQFKQGRVWLLLDGLDEMSVDYPLTNINRQIREGGSISQARIILTCRVNLWDYSSNELYNFDTYRTLDFSYPDQVETFLEKWFSKSEEAGEKGQRLCTALKEPGKERIRDLVKNPLRLALLCLNWLSREGKLPDTKAGLYQQFVDDFYRWKTKQFSTTSTQRQQLNQKLGKLAKEAIDKEVSRFRLREDFVKGIFNDDYLLDLARKLGWLNQVGIDENRKPFYAFFHASFQEYFAATVIDARHFFLNHIPKKPSRGTYRIFEPRWKEVILLWLGRPEEKLKQQKEAFVEDLVEFDDGFGEWLSQKGVDKGFYEYRAYFLAAAGITEFEDYSRADEIVKQIVRWGFGYLDEKQNQQKFHYVIKSRAQQALQETDQTKAITSLVKLLESTKDIFTLWDAAESLVKIGMGSEMAIAALANLLESTEDEYTRRYAAESLGNIGMGSETAIAVLANLLESTEDEEIRWQAADSLGEIDPGNEMAIFVLLQMFESTEDEEIRWQAAQSLGKIDPGNETAIFTLVQLLVSTKKAESLGNIGMGSETAIAALVKLLELTQYLQYNLRQAFERLREIDPCNETAVLGLVQMLKLTDDEVTRWQAAYSLGKIGTGNEMAIAALLQLLEFNENEEIRWQAAYSLGKIDPGNETAITTLVQLLKLNQYLQYDFRHVAESLGEIGMGNEMTIRELTKLLEKTENGCTRRLAIESLGKIGMGNEMAIRELAKLLESTENGCARRLAVESLGKIGMGNKMVIIELEKLLESTENGYARRQAAYSLGKIDPGNETAIAVLLQLLESTENEDTRRQAAESLGEIDPGNEMAISTLLQLLESPEDEEIRWQEDEEIRWQAAYSLGKIDPGNETVIAVLLQLLNLIKYTRRLAVENLGKIGMGNETAIAALANLLESTEDKYTRRLAVESLGKIGMGNETAIAALANLLESAEDEYTRMQAADSLGEIGTESETAIAALANLLESAEDEYTRRHAADSLGEIGMVNEAAIAA